MYREKKEITARGLRVGSAYRERTITALTTIWGGPIWGSPSLRDVVHYRQGFWVEKMSVARFLKMVNK